MPQEQTMNGQESSAASGDDFSMSKEELYEVLPRLEMSDDMPPELQGLLVYQENINKVEEEKLALGDSPEDLEKLNACDTQIKVMGELLENHYNDTQEYGGLEEIDNYFKENPSLLETNASPEQALPELQQDAPSLTAPKI